MTQRWIKTATVIKTSTIYKHMDLAKAKGEAPANEKTLQ